MKAEVNLTEYRKSGDYAHFIGVWTVGCMELTSDEREAVEDALNNAPKGDHFYSIGVRETEQRVFVAENGEFGYTAMLPEEY